MKRFLLFVIGVLFLGTAQAQETDQTFQFIDNEGNVVPDGSVITVNSINTEGQMIVPLFVQKVSSEKAAVSLYETISDIPSGQWQTCAFGNCIILEESGYSSKTIVSDQMSHDIQTEWIPEQGMYASWTATLQIRRMNTQTKFGVEQAGTLVLGYGPSVTIHFVYADPAGINTVKTANEGEERYFTPSGRMVSRQQRGLCIVKLADGSVIKRFNK